MSVFFTYGLSDKYRKNFFFLSFLYPISIFLLFFLNDNKLNFYTSIEQTNNFVLIYLSYFFLSCTFYLIYLFFRIIINYIQHTNGFFYPYGDNFKILLTQREELLNRIHFLKQIYFSVIAPSKSFLGNLEKNKNQFRFISKAIGNKEHSVEHFKNLTLLENKLKGDKPLLKNDAHTLYTVAFLHEYERLIKLFTIKGTK